MDFVQKQMNMDYWPWLWLWLWLVVANAFVVVRVNAFSVPTTSSWALPTTKSAWRRPSVRESRSTTLMSLGVPKVPYRLPGSRYGEWVDIFQRLTRERIVFIGQEIDDEFANQIIGLLLVSVIIHCSYSSISIFPDVKRYFV
jgi:hypothetical protein